MLQDLGDVGVYTRGIMVQGTRKSPIASCMCRDIVLYVCISLDRKADRNTETLSIRWEERG